MVQLNRRAFLTSSMAVGLTSTLALGKLGQAKTTRPGTNNTLANQLFPIPPEALARMRESDELIDYDALGLAQLIKAREITARELVEVVIRRIEAMEPIINVLTTPTFERALEKADQIPLNSTFAGVPILIKDMIDVGGVRRTDGSRLQLTNVPVRNVRYIDGVEAAGMNIVGMTNVPEFAQLGIVTNNSAFGLSRNPWDLSKSTLGSSGGAGAAVAAGILPLVHGTDGGGSNRLPACANGVFGMKPSRERMLSGESDGGHNPFKTNQALSRTVRDSAALFNDTEDKSSRVFEPVGLVTGPSTRRLKIGYAASIRGGLVVEEPVRKAQENVVRLLQDLGHEVVEVTFPVNEVEFFTNYNGAFLRQFGTVAESTEILSGRAAAESGLLDPFTASLIEYGASITDEQEAQGQAYLAKVPGFYIDTFESIDILMSPVMPVLFVEGDALTPNDRVNDSTLEFLQNRLAYTAPTNVAGNPAMSVPLNWNDESGLPIGTMFQAAIGNDKMLYELAYELEEARPWKEHWAPYSVKYIPV
ncbi:MAG: amidase [Okeania sp. SIO2C2]|uniref:amidase n=1 Tax=Okeania sp. SIO2C2 TaxID=2607787 RepID=UPI0013BB30AB|nr:amidase [Okeania sp. SIO2C2]NEP87558.1 amidase [Okeania sp. SIO2C2]